MKKFQWSHGIVAAFIIFIGFLFIMLWVALHSNIDLVTDNYYEKELQYQTHIDVVKNSREINKEMSVTASGKEIFLEFPHLAPASEYSGNIFFFRPSNKSQDFNVPVVIDSSFSQKISMKNYYTGMWRVKISWAVQGKKYYYEQPIIVQ